MNIILFLFGLLGIITFIAIILVKLFKKIYVKKYFYGLLFSFLVAFLGILLTPIDENNDDVVEKNSDTIKNDNINKQGNSVVENIEEYKENDNNYSDGLTDSEREIELKELRKSIEEGEKRADNEKTNKIWNDLLITKDFNRFLENYYSLEDPYEQKFLQKKMNSKRTFKINVFVIDNQSLTNKVFLISDYSRYKGGGLEDYRDDPEVSPYVLSLKLKDKNNIILYEEGMYLTVDVEFRSAGSKNLDNGIIQYWAFEEK